MGVEFHITRAKYWTESENSPITPEEWLAYVDADPELKLDQKNGRPYYALWDGPSAHKEPWLDWSGGEIITKWPDTALYLKMLDIANHFGANVQDDEFTVYTLPGDWQFDPYAKFVPPPRKKPWWKFW